MKEPENRLPIVNQSLNGRFTVSDLKSYMAKTGQGTRSLAFALSTSRDKIKRFLAMPDGTILHIKPSLQMLSAFGPKVFTSKDFPDFFNRYIQLLRARGFHEVAARLLESNTPPKIISAGIVYAKGGDAN